MERVSITREAATNIVGPNRVVCSLEIPGDPVAKGRPRFARGRVITPNATKSAERKIGWQIKAAYPGIEPMMAHDLGVRLWFATATRRRRDIDNLVKLVLDACNNIVWHDDVQIVELVALLMRGSSHPRTELLVYRIGESRIV